MPAVNVLRCVVRAGRVCHPQGVWWFAALCSSVTCLGRMPHGGLLLRLVSSLIPHPLQALESQRHVCVCVQHVFPHASRTQKEQQLNCLLATVWYCCAQHVCCYCVAVMIAVVKPRWPLQMIDPGDRTRQSGWYDVQCQGAVNDFCRWIGTDNGAYWSCAMAGREIPTTVPMEIPEQYAISTACQEVGYKAQALSGLNCGDVSLPWENSCQTRQCCKAKCDNNPLCTGFVFGNSEGDNCRSTGDGQNCCWLKGGDCRSVVSPLTASYVRAQAGRWHCVG